MNCQVTNIPLSPFTPKFETKSIQFTKTPWNLPGDIQLKTEMNMISENTGYIQFTTDIQKER